MKKFRQEDLAAVNLLLKKVKTVKLPQAQLSEDCKRIVIGDKIIAHVSPKESVEMFGCFGDCGYNRSCYVLIDASTLVERIECPASSLHDALDELIMQAIDVEVRNLIKGIPQLNVRRLH
jgi:hypothetical protein